MPVVGRVPVQAFDRFLPCGLLFAPLISLVLTSAGC
jgi:hypothetical protein